MGPGLGMDWSRKIRFREVVSGRIYCVRDRDSYPVFAGAVRENFWKHFSKSFFEKFSAEKKC
jgi:hypothetical protein